MSNSYFYKAYNLVVESCMPLNGFYVIEAQDPSVSIRVGDVPEHLEKATFRKIDENGAFEYEMNDNSFLMTAIASRKRVLIENKKDILIQDTDHYFENILDSVLTTLLLLRGCFSMHASAIKFRNKAIIFTGISGAGKSTTAAKLKDMGYEFLSEDSCLFTTGLDNKLYLHPAYPQIRLWQQSVDALNYDTSNIPYVSDNWRKYKCHVEYSDIPEPALASHIFKLIPDNKATTVSVRQVLGFDAFSVINNNTINFLVPPLQLKNAYFQFCTQLAAQVKVIEIRRPTREMTLEDVVNCIVNEIEQTELIST